MSKISPSKVPASSAGSTSPFTIVEVKKEEEFRSFIDCLNRIFTDPTDLESDDEFARLFRSPSLARFYLLIDSKGSAIGLQLIRINPHVPDAMYVPYGGLLTEYRGSGLYPHMARFTAGRMLERGVKFSLNDVEDPGRIAGVYPDEKHEEVLRRCRLRIDFFKRALGMHFVNDHGVPYCRPASNDPQQIQAYDLLGIRPLDDKDPMWRTIFNDTKTAIRKDAYEHMYLSLMQIEYGTIESAPTAQELRRRYPAIEEFLTSLNRCHQEWVLLDCT